MYYMRLIMAFFRLSAQSEMAYRSNFFISLLHSVLNFAAGLLGLVVLFNQVQMLQGWNLSSSLALLGVYFILDALNGLVIGPGFEGLAGLDGEVWTGRFDFTLLRPVNAQFLASFRNWRIFSLIDVVLGIAVLGVAIVRLSSALTLVRVLLFLLALVSGAVTMYAILLTFTALVFWSPGFLFTWIFNGLFQMARYPTSFYPGWLRLVLTWIIPVGIMTTIPAQALSGDIPSALLVGSVIFALTLLAGASYLFQTGLKHYASASS